MSTITLPLETIEKVEKQLEKALRQVRSLKKEKKRSDPDKPKRFWTSKEWEKAEKEADEDIKVGRVKKFDSMKDLIKELNS